jgi:hypothetical protein
MFLQGPNPRAAAELMKMDGIVDTLVRLVSTGYVSLRTLKTRKSYVREVCFVCDESVSFLCLLLCCIQAHMYFQVVPQIHSKRVDFIIASNCLSTPCGSVYEHSA